MDPFRSVRGSVGNLLWPNPQIAWLSAQDPTTLLGDWPKFYGTDRKHRLAAAALCHIVRGDMAVHPELQEIIDAIDRLAEGGLARKIITMTQDCLDRFSYAANEQEDRLLFAVRCCLMGSRHGLQRLASCPDVVGSAVTCDVIRDVFGNPWMPLTTVHWQDGAGRRCVGSMDDPHRSWLTPQVLDLAAGAYRARDPKDATLDPCALAVLSDALKEEGCDDPNLLGHLLGQPYRAYTCDQQGTHKHPGRQGQVMHGVYHYADPSEPHHHHDDRCTYVDVPQDKHYRGCWALDMILHDTAGPSQGRD
jgi:hypothetical protein